MTKLQIPNKFIITIKQKFVIWKLKFGYCL